jgi:ribosomal protein S18 acetylase RimI-like enzyme
LRPPHVLSTDAGIIICRAELHDAEVVLESVWSLAKASMTASRWSRDAFYPYLAREVDNGALQTKALFLATVGAAASAGPRSGVDEANSSKGRIVGFAAFSTIMSVNAAESTLENMAVAKPWQRRGIGRRLLSAGLLWCRAHASETVFLEVRESNRAAIALYESVGFKPAGFRPGYYCEPAEAGLQMQKFLGLVNRPS